MTYKDTVYFVESWWVRQSSSKGPILEATFLWSTNSMVVLRFEHDFVRVVWKENVFPTVEEARKEVFRRRLQGGRHESG